jgi:NADH-quinone oxidoreductase subunit C
MEEALRELGEQITQALAGSVSSYRVEYGELTLDADAAKIVEVAKFLRDDARCQFVSFIDICGAQHPELFRTEEH